MSETSTTPADVADVEEALRDVVDPELRINVVDIGLVYGVMVDQNNQAIIDTTPTPAACPLTDVIEVQAVQALEASSRACGSTRSGCRRGASDKITDEGRGQLRTLGFSV